MADTLLFGDSIDLLFQSMASVVAYHVLLRCSVETSLIRGFRITWGKLAKCAIGITTFLKLFSLNAGAERTRSSSYLVFVAVVLFRMPG